MQLKVIYGKVTALSMSRSFVKLGLISVLIALAVLAVAIPLGALSIALRVGGFYLLDGIVFGLLLAGVTRCRRPLLIYLLLAATAFTFWPFYSGWSIDRTLLSEIPEGRQELIYNGIDILRIIMFLVGIPYAFARFGFHAPDVNAPGVMGGPENVKLDNEIKIDDSE